MVQWGGSGPFIAENSDAISWNDLVQYFTSSTLLHRVSCSNKILPNTPKHYEMHTNMSLGSNGVDRVRLLRKIPIRFHGTNFCINCTSSTRFAPSLGSNGVGRVHSLRKITKTTLWHELVH